MITEIFMPKMSTSMTEGQLVKMYKAIGDPVEKGEPLMEIMTDKVNMEVEATGSGVLREMFIKEGDSVPVGATIGIIADKDEEIPEKYLKGTADNDKKEEKVEVKEEVVVEKKDKKIKAPASTSNKKVKVTPRAKKLAKDKGVDISLVPAKDGVVTEKEVMSFIEANKVKASPLAEKMASDKNIDLKDIEGSGVGGKIMKADLAGLMEDSQEYEAVPFTGIRKIVADRLSSSKFTAPHLYFSVEVDMKDCIDFRVKANEKLSKKQLKISFTDIFVAAVSKSLVEYREVNAGIFDDEIRMFKNTNIGVAVETERGLLVPVINNTNKMTLSEIAEKSSDIISRARKGQINPDEMKDGTFTISNLGLYDIDFFTAIINPPQSAILAVSSIKEKPVVRDGEIVIRPIMKLVLSVDHRIIDGALATKFLDQIKEYLENPAYLCL
ncbi:MAG: dihydrolipoamide acetyltransferase family protein [Tepidanaerobacteraceae bacterium]|jgi:pyruvate dehydrogenase E2 component (dihydrolipoamide acetyltransferase)